MSASVITDLAVLSAPRLLTEVPGPEARARIERDGKVTSPSLPRAYGFVPKRGSGSVVEDVDGNQFLDFTAGVAVCATGHSHPKVVAAIEEQTRRFLHMAGTDFYYSQQADLAERLTAGKAEEAVATAMIHQSFGKAGRQILVEEFLEGEEVSILALVDGRQAVLLPSAQDHKRALDGDLGLNTGGMGAYSPAPMETAAFRKMVLDTIFNPTLKELHRRDITYRGVLYAGLMLTAAGPKVLEFNCRFGDPETQAILPRLKGDLIPAMEACISGNLLPEHAACRPEACVCVVMTAGGYPEAYRKGDAIAGLKEAAALSDTMVFHAGTKRAGGQIVTAGGRVLGVTALGRTLSQTAEKAYQAVARITFQDAHYRRDIAAKGIKRG